MKRLIDIAQDKADVTTIVYLTSAFEGLASMHIGNIKNQVLKSQLFFDELWQIYTQIRVDSLFRYGRSQDQTIIDKELFIAITAEGGFSGDIDQKLVLWMLKDYDPARHDIIIIGHHGALQLIQAGVQFKKYFRLPSKDQNINVKPLVPFIHAYRTTAVYYQTYVSLMVQDIKKIELRKAVQEAGGRLKDEPDTINEQTYIFEPSTFAVIAHLESSMVEIALSQTILDSKLAQYASRFRAMTVAKDRALDSQKALSLQFSHAKRALADERLKETINGLKKAGVHA